MIAGSWPGDDADGDVSPRRGQLRNRPSHPDRLVVGVGRDNEDAQPGPHLKHDVPPPRRRAAWVARASTAARIIGPLADRGAAAAAADAPSSHSSKRDRSVITAHHGDRIRVDRDDLPGSSGAPARVDVVGRPDVQRRVTPCGERSGIGPGARPDEPVDVGGGAMEVESSVLGVSLRTPGGGPVVLRSPGAARRQPPARRARRPALVAGRAAVCRRGCARSLAVRLHGNLHDEVTSVDVVCEVEHAHCGLAELLENRPWDDRTPAVEW